MLKQHLGDLSLHSAAEKSDLRHALTHYCPLQACNYKTWLNIFCRRSLTHKQSLSVQAAAPGRSMKNAVLQYRCYIYFIFIQVIKNRDFFFLQSSSHCWKYLRYLTSVHTALFQPGGLRCCFTFTWRCAWSFFRGSFSQVVQLDGWCWLLKQRWEKRPLLKIHL